MHNYQIILKIVFVGLTTSKALLRKPTCFKNPDDHTCIDLILINRQKTLQNFIIIESGLSDFHKLTVTVLKSLFKGATKSYLMH